MNAYASSRNGIFHITILAAIVGAVGLLVVRRPEALVLTAVPVVGLMVLNFRTATVLTTWVILIWLSRIVVVFFDFLLFSYAVYGCLCLTLAAYVVRLGAPRRTPLRLLTNPWIWLFVAVLIVGGVRGAANVGGIPPWLLDGDGADYATPWVYVRTVVLPAMFLPLLAILVAGAVQDRQKLSAFIVPMCAHAWTMSLLIMREVVMSGQSLLVMAQPDERYEHLTSLGFHSNELGTMLAVTYAVLLGTRDGVERRAGKAAMSLTLVVTSIALILTFSRGAYAAFAVTNALFFMQASPRRRTAFITVVLLLWVAAPAAVVNRAGYALDSKDPNTISAGRVDNIWMPLLPDVGNHLFFGQGLQSIMWTEAQRFQLIYPVNLSHNAYLDLLLDFGLIGSLPILAWYVYLWRGFRRQAALDSDERFRRFFYGGQLALVSLALCALTNDRLTPTATTALLWIAAGVLMGRESAHDAPSVPDLSFVETNAQRPRLFRMNRVAPGNVVSVS